VALPLLIPLAVGGVVVAGLAGAQVKDGFDSVFKQPGAPSGGGGGLNVGKADLVFYLLIAGGALYVIGKGKEVLK